MSLLFYMKLSFAGLFFDLDALCIAPWTVTGYSIGFFAGAYADIISFSFFQTGKSGGRTVTGGYPFGISEIFGGRVFNLISGCSGNFFPLYIGSA